MLRLRSQRIFTVTASPVRTMPMKVGGLMPKSVILSGVSVSSSSLPSGWSVARVTKVSSRLPPDRIRRPRTDQVCATPGTAGPAGRSTPVASNLIYGYVSVFSAAYMRLCSLSDSLTRDLAVSRREPRIAAGSAASISPTAEVLSTLQS